MDTRQFKINFLGDVSDSGTSITFFYQTVLQDIWLYLFFRVEYPNTWQFCCQASWDVPHSQTSVFLVLIAILWMNITQLPLQIFNFCLGQMHPLKLV